MSKVAEVSHALELAAQIVSAHVSRNPTHASDLPDIITAVHGALIQAGYPEPTQQDKEPAVPVRRSVFEDRVLCLECGKPYSTLKRHLRADHKLTPEAYRERFRLPDSYPLIAPAYAARRVEIAKNAGLGRRGATERMAERKRA